MRAAVFPAVRNVFDARGNSMWDQVLQLLALRCRHRHLSKPFSDVSTSGHNVSHTEWDSVSTDRPAPYVVCLDCGKHFGYDWSRMQVMK